jgi:hypothetical protein
MNPPVSVVCLLALCALQACGDESAVGCTELEAGAEQDGCFKDQIQEMDASQLKEVESVALQINDSMVRSYAVSTWVKDHSNEISLEQGTVLCQLLEGREQSYCLRRLSSPHLQR